MESPRPARLLPSLRELRFNGPAPSIWGKDSAGRHEGYLRDYEYLVTSQLP